MIEFRVVKAVQQMDRAGARRGHAHARFAGELRVSAGHERRHLFMPHLHEVDGVAGALERTHDSVDAVARIAVNALHSPLLQTFDKKIAGRTSHCSDTQSRRVPRADKPLSLASLVIGKRSCGR